MERIVVVDEQGRLVIPAEIRKRSGLKKGGQVLVKLVGDEIVIVKIDKDLEGRVDEWYASMKSRSVPAFTEEEEFEEPKWISDEYVRRKLGIG